jgi:hypothetical protein
LGHRNAENGFSWTQDLSIVKDTIVLLRANEGMARNPDTIPLDDALTFTLFQKEKPSVSSSSSQQACKNICAGDSYHTKTHRDECSLSSGPMNYIPMFISREAQ